MPIDINWGILTNGTNALVRGIENAARDFAEERDRRRTRTALSNYLAAPSDGTLSELRRINPKLSLEAQTAVREDQSRKAMSDYVVGRYGGGNNSLVAPVKDAAAPVAAAPISGAPAVATSPNAAGDDAFTRLARADPAAAMKARFDALKLDGEQIDLADKINGIQLRLLSGAHDQPSWEDAKRRARAHLTKLGIPFGEDDAPEQFDPQWVNDRRLEALATDKYFAELRGRQRFAWDMEDDQIDNERADRDLEDRILDRSARRNLTRRGQDMSSSDRRRGQDMSSTDRRREQDMSSADRRRGQDMRPRGARSGSGGAPGSAPTTAAPARPTLSPTRSAPVRVNTPAEAMRLPSGTRFMTPDGRLKVVP